MIHHSHDPAPRRRLRVMTYNIHHGRGIDRRYDLERIANVIDHERPHIVALQEIEQFSKRTRSDNQPEILARCLNMDYVFTRVMDHRHTGDKRGSGFGLAILSRLPIKAHEHFDLSYRNAREPRACLHTTLSAGETPLHVFCVHLGLPYRERLFQVERLLSNDIVNNGKFGNGPKILLGDFNNWWPVSSARLINKCFHNACQVTGRKRLRTFGKFFNFLCLDYIFASHDLKIMSCHTLTTRLARVASDHRPVVCSVQISTQRSTHP
ncbi:MAG: endonuclease/exonuclease/phosphatase family protein [bacterium]|nr:endonuclease/exonuclease/phosphatase family protein [Candidatus Sumerlaeota bacterium]